MLVKDSSCLSREETLICHRQAVERVIVAMRERLHEPLSLHDMSAEIAHMSLHHFVRVFHQITGAPPIKFLSALRLDAAKSLLLTTSLSVTDVCFEVGYNSLGTFTSRFTQLVGLPPRQFRRFAARIKSASLEDLGLHYGEAPKHPDMNSCIKGRIDAPVPTMGLIFVGLFEAQIPQSYPVGGTLLVEPGMYSIGQIPDGTYYLMAATLPNLINPESYLLPDHKMLHVGAGRGQLLVRRGRAYGDTNLTLRPIELTDPPLLISLPLLLARASSSGL